MSEQAFAEARDCVIVATSTLELGIDVGDLDRAIQSAPATVAAFLQRIGRTGRRPAPPATASSWPSTRTLLHAGGLLLALVAGLGRACHAASRALAHRRSADSRPLPAEKRSASGLAGLAGSARAEAPGRSRHLLDEGFLDRDGGMLLIGPEPSRVRPPSLHGPHRGLHRSAGVRRPAGRDEIGRPIRSCSSAGRRARGCCCWPAVVGRSPGSTGTPALLRRAHRGRRHRPVAHRAPGGTSFALARAMRDVLLGTDPSSPSPGVAGTLAGLRSDVVGPPTPTAR